MQLGVLFVNMQYQRRIGGRRGYGADSSPVGLKSTAGGATIAPPFFMQPHSPKRLRPRGLAVYPYRYPATSRLRLKLSHC